MHPDATGWLKAVPALFVLLWSSGFIGAKYGLPYAEPLTFLLLRFACVLAILAPAALLMRAPWPSSGTALAHIAVSGALIHGGYLSGVFGAIHRGMPAGMVAVIAGLQPVLTALAARHALGEQLRARQWTGLALGLAGVLLVVSDRVAWQIPAGDALALALLALLGITAGTVYQKRYCTGMDLRTGSVVQFAAAAVVLAPFALLTETMAVRWTPQFAFALGWLTLVLSIGAISLLLMMIRHGEAARVSSLFYLTPPTTAVIAFLLFEERLGIAALAGMVLAAAAVALVNRR